MKHASEGENVYTLRLHKDFRYSAENTTHHHTLPPTHIHPSESIMWKASHTHTNRQLIFTKESYEPTNTQPVLVSNAHLHIHLEALQPPYS